VRKVWVDTKGRNNLKSNLPGKEFFKGLINKKGLNPFKGKKKGKPKPFL